MEEPDGLSEIERTGEGGARAVLIAWARALERKDFERARSFYAGAAADTDLAERLAQFEVITIAAPIGRMEAAAGSLYYSSPVNLTGVDASGARTKLQGPIELRRANDVPGASADHLRWRIHSVQLKPVP